MPEPQAFEPPPQTAAAFQAATGCSDAQLADMQAYMNTFPAPQRGGRPG